MALAIVGYFVLHALAVPAPMKLAQPRYIGQMASRMLWQLTYYGQFILLMLYLLGAAISAFKQKQRRTLNHQFGDFLYRRCIGRHGIAGI